MIRLYYAGNDGGHCSWRKGFLCLAWLRLDGFAGMQSDDDKKPGTVVTRPILCTGKRLYVNADARGGSVRVEVLGTEELNLGQSQTISGDNTNGPVRWSSQADLTRFIGQTVRLKFELQQATLYSFTFGN